MKHRKLLLLLTVALFPACQTRLKEVVADQDRQLENLQTDRQRLMSERDRVRAENASLQERLTLEQMRAQELEERLAAARDGSAAASDSEVRGLQGRLEGTGVEVGRRGGHIVLNLPNEITFGSGRADLTRNGKSNLDAVASILNTDYPGHTLWVEGHTDNDPIRKSKWDSNLHLSVMRALAVAQYLSKDLGIDPSLVRVAGYGEFAPKVDNATPEHKAQNRRVEILILG